MPRKPATLNDSGAAAAAARSAKPKSPRVNSAKHSRKSASEAASPEIEVTVVEPVMVVEEIMEPVILVAAPEPDATAAPEPVALDAREEIARIAYGFWEARGRSGGDPLEDWVRAETEYFRNRVA
jgi:hypothetical protein